MYYAGVYGVLYNAVDAGGSDVAPLFVPYALLGQVTAKALGAVALIDILLKNQLDGLGLVWLYCKVTYRFISPVGAPLLFQSVAIGDTAASKVTLLGQLLHAGLGADRGLDTLPGGLPVADVVQELVNMGIKPLLALHSAPDLNPVLDEPLHYEDEMDGTGNYPYRYFDSYFEDASDRKALYIMDGHLIVGFVMINRHSAIGSDIDYAIAEFTVFPAYRKRRCGSKAVSCILAQFPGRWEVKYSLKNGKAAQFWEKATQQFKPKAVDLNGEEQLLLFSTASN